MKQVIAVLLAVHTGTGCVATSPPRIDPSREAAVLESLQREWAAAYVALDTGRVGRLLAADYFVIHPETAGRVADRSRAIQAILDHDPDRPIYAYDQEQIETRIYWPVALVTGISHLRMRHITTGAEDDIRGRYLHVWVNRGGEWKLVSRQATPMPND